MTKNIKEVEPKRLRNLLMPDSLWNDVQDVAREESRRTGKVVTASDVMRDGTVREVRRLRRRLQEVAVKRFNEQ